MPSGSGSLERFARTAMLMKDVSARTPLPDATLSILDEVAQPGWTRWSVAYDITHREVVWKTPVSAQRKTLRLSDVDFACSAPMMMIDVNTPAAGDVSARLVRYTPQANLDLLLESYAATSFLRGTPRADIEADASHGEASRCQAHRFRPVTH